MTNDTEPLPGPTDPDADLEIVCAACLTRPPAPRDTLCAECRRVGDAQPLGPRPTTHCERCGRLLAGPECPCSPPGRGQLVQEIARLREGARKIFARAFRELTCAPGEEAPRTALRVILDEARALAEGG